MITSITVKLEKEGMTDYENMNSKYYLRYECYAIHLYKDIYFLNCI